MKKKTRKIVVDGVEYAWLIVDHSSDLDGGITLRVYCGSILVLNEWITDRDMLPITPKKVRDRIKAI